MLGNEQDCYGGCTDSTQAYYGLMDEVCSPCHLPITFDLLPFSSCPGVLPAQLRARGTPWSFVEGYCHHPSMRTVTSQEASESQRRDQEGCSCRWTFVCNLTHAKLSLKQYGCPPRRSSLALTRRMPSCAPTAEPLPHSYDPTQWDRDISASSPSAHFLRSTLHTGCLHQPSPGVAGTM